MAIEYWERGGRPKDYNPLPSSWTEKIILDPGDYRVTFKAMSPTGMQLGVKLDTTNVYPFNQAVTTELKEYELNFTNPIQQPLYFKGTTTPDNIVVKDIKVVEKPTGKTTINGVDGFGTVKPGFNGKLRAIGDFTGKVAGDLSANPFTAKYSANGSLTAPSGFVSEAGSGAGALSYDRLKAADGLPFVQSFSSNGQIAQQLFTFDIISLLEKQITINAIPYADKIKWLHDNVDKITVDWTGNGSGPAGNKANLRLWFYGGDAWGLTTASHTNATPTTISRNISSDVGNTIGPGGFVHAIAYADASNGTVNSLISTDYVSITVDIKQGAVVESKWTYHPNSRIIDNETLELTAPAAVTYASYVEMNNVEPGESYYMYIDDASSGYIYYEQRNESNQILVSSYGTAKFKTVTMLPNAKKLVVGLYNATQAGTYISKKPIVVKGSAPVPYEPKRGERMVLPQIKNLLNLAGLERGKFITSGNSSDYSALGSNLTDYIPLNPNTTYTPTNIRAKGSSVIGLTFYNANKVNIGGIGYAGGNSTILGALGQFTTPANTAFARFTLYDEDLDKAQLEEGTIQTPYEPYEVRRARKANLTIPKKNLIPDISQWAGNWSNNSTFARNGNGVKVTLDTAKLSSSAINNSNLPMLVEAGKTYTLSYLARANRDGVRANYNYLMKGGAGRGNVSSPNPPALTTAWKRYSQTFDCVNTADDGHFMLGLVNSSGNVNGDWIEFSEVQVEIGPETPFEPFKLQARRARKETPKKNLFDKTKATVGMFINSGTGVPTASGLGQAVSDFMPVSASTSYVGSGIKSAPASSGGIGLAYFNQSLAYIGGLSYDQGKSLGAFTTPANAAFVRITFMGTDIDFVQLEPGTAPTPYEPYKLMGRPARKGLEFNGIGDGALLPSITMDSIEFDCLLKPNSNANSFLFDARGYANVWVSNASPNISTGTTVFLEGQEVPKAWTSFPLDKRIKIKAVHNAPFTSAVTLLSNFGRAAGTITPGILYGIKCYLNGVVVAEFNFTNPKRNLGTTFKGEKGEVGTIYGNPLQLNRQARR